MPELQAAAEKLQLEVERLTAEAVEVPISELQDFNYWWDMFVYECSFYSVYALGVLTGPVSSSQWESRKGVLAAQPL